jgi:hypothetical protein
VPGRKRPSSTLDVELTCGAEENPVNGAVSAEVPLSGTAHQEQKLPLLSRPQDGHRIVVAIDQPIVSASFLERKLTREPSGTVHEFAQR